MGTIAETTYLGNLRTLSKHLKSGHAIDSDAPTDNFGKGERFSPTDSMATSLTTCMITVMGIAAQNHQFTLKHVKAKTGKVMGSNPRRILEIHIDIEIGREADWNEKTIDILEAAARNCPVAKSLHPEVVQKVQFSYKALNE